MLVLVSVVLLAALPLMAAWLAHAGDGIMLASMILAGGFAAHLALLAAQAYALPEWAIVTLMLAGTVVAAGHPLKYWEYAMDAVNAATAARLPNALASAATGLLGGVVATLISAAVGATFSAAIVVRESANSACVLGSVVAGYILCILVTFVPDEPEHRRIHAFFALCTKYDAGRNRLHVLVLHCGTQR